MASVYVTNNSEKPLKDGFSGVFYEFAVGKTVEIPEEAAAHIFGYGVEDKIPHLTRLGWSVSQNDLGEALQKLSQWDFSVENPQKNHILSPVVEQVPFPKRGRGKVLSAVA
jgi:hypothetical protein